MSLEWQVIRKPEIENENCNALTKQCQILCKWLANFSEGFFLGILWDLIFN